MSVMSECKGRSFPLAVLGLILITSLGATRGPVPGPKSISPMQGPASKSLLPTLDIHFTIITNGQPRNTVNYNDPAVLEQMVNLLNQAFVTQSGQRLVNFRYKSTTPVQSRGGEI